MTLRATTRADLGHVVAWETQDDTSRWLGETGHAWHERALDDPDQQHLIAENSGAPAGFAVLAGLDAPHNAVELRRMVIAAALRDAGHGRALLKAVLDHARHEHRSTSVWLDVKAHNIRARRLYETEGFVVTRAISDAVIESDGRPADLLVMTRQLDS